jgi:competence protein ComGC
MIDLIISSLVIHQLPSFAKTNNRRMKTGLQSLVQETETIYQKMRIIV